MILLERAMDHREPWMAPIRNAVMDDGRLLGSVAKIELLSEGVVNGDEEVGLPIPPTFQGSDQSADRGGRVAFAPASTNRSWLS